MYNRIVLVGRLATDPELRYIPSGQPVVRFRLAVDRPARRNVDGDNRNGGTDFFSVIAWRKLAEQVSGHLVKGRLVLVEGRVQIREYKDRNGASRRAVEVVAERVRFLDRPRAQGAGGEEPVDAIGELGVPEAPEAEIDLGDEFEEVPF